jgi:chaperonin GroES
MAAQKIKPLFTNVLIKPLDSEQKLPSGLVLPDSAKEKPQVGEVMAVGDGVCCEACECEGKDSKFCDCKGEMAVKVGQKVMYKKWGGNEVKVNGQEWTIVEQKDILAIVE